MLVNEKVKVRWNNANKKHYVNLGYTFTSLKDEFEVKTSDLPNSSSVKVKVKCDYCGNIYEPTYKNYNVNHEEGKDCCKSCRSKKASKTMKDKYGVPYYTQTNEFKNRVKQTCLDKYGVSNPSQDLEIQNKKKKTNLRKFGSEWYVSSKDFVDKCQENYGETNPMKSKEVQQKAVQSLIKNGTVPISKEEKELIAMLKEIYGDSCCYPSYPENKFVLDCLLTIDDIKIDVEYDGWYWHKSRQRYDRARDEVLKTKGYKILRIVSNGKLPSKEQLREAVDYLKVECNDFSKIKIDI